jgi:hypothetical protein
MTIYFDLPLELETELSNEALQLNLPLSEYILHLLSTRKVSGNLPKTGAELVAYWQNAGVIHSRPEIVDSQVYARQLRRDAETRDRTENRQ